MNEKCINLHCWQDVKKEFQLCKSVAESNMNLLSSRDSDVEVSGRGIIPGEELGMGSMSVTDSKKTCVEYRPGGEQCDHCGKKFEKTNQCAKCRVVWYCSTDCQAAHWSEGHKKICKKREEGQLVKGDTCRVHGLIKNADFNGERFTVVSDEQTNGRWQCQLSIIEENKHMLPEAALREMPPPMLFKRSNLSLLVKRKSASSAAAAAAA